MILGLVVLDEELPPQFLGALALILAGLAVSQLRAPRRRTESTFGPSSAP